jgi:uncharacterized membrane protein YdjX (TVP38/TMEM64 family)
MESCSQVENAGRLPTTAPESSRSSRGGARLLIGGGVLVALLAASFLLPTRDILTAVLEWTQSLGVWGPVLLAAIYIVACVLFIPGSLLTLGAGALFGLWWGYLSVTVGSVAGASAAFIIGRTIGRGWIEQKVASNRKFRAIDDAVGREGFKIVLLTRLSPVFPFNLLNYAYGVTRVSFRDYFLASLLGMIPGTLMYVYFGSAAKGLAEIASGKVQGGLAQQIFFFAGLLATVAVTVLVTRVARKALSQAIDQKEEQEDAE